MNEDPIRHVVVLMLENRSFDHFLGRIPGVDGVDPGKPRSNYERPGSATAYEQDGNPDDKLRYDPGHSHDSVLRQIADPQLGSMGGFVYDYALTHPKKQHAWEQVMAYYELGRLPVLHRLAQDFAVCDEWFSSVPGPTWTNRFFAHSGTSRGWVSMPKGIPKASDFNKYDQTTIFDRLLERGLEWRVYFGDIPQSLVLMNQRKKEHRKRYSWLSNFAKDVASATDEDFPEYVFIEPHYFWPGRTDQHPPHSVLRGDGLIGEVYNAIRGNEELWDSTLLIVTYDEHGGLYDHVEPPIATPPDGDHHEGFSFDLFGVRVPTVLISKWIKPGTFRPAPGARMDHTSTLKYLIDKHGLNGLGARTATAASIGDAVTTTPMTEVPDAFEGLSLEVSALEFMDRDEPDEELNDNQEALLRFTEALASEMPRAIREFMVGKLLEAPTVKSRVEAARAIVAFYLEGVEQNSMGA